MKKVVVFPDEMLSRTKEVLLRKDPGYLHSTVWIVLSVILTAFFVCLFGKIDDVVKAKGMVRPAINISSVKNIAAGEIEELFYRPGDFVRAGDSLLLIRGKNIQAAQAGNSAKILETTEKISGLEQVILAFEKKCPLENCISTTIAARYEAFLTERELLETKQKRCLELFNQEKELPASSTTKSEIETKEYEYKVSMLEYEDFCSNFISNVRQELDSLKIERENLIQEKTELEEQVRSRLLVSPVDGYVQEMSSLNVGDYVFSDQPVLNIVPPSSENCRIELNIPAAKMGKLEEGQLVKLRFPAFPFAEFKGTTGHLQVIQPDALNTENGLFFTAYTDVDSMKLYDQKGRGYELKPGFEVDARIVLERQSLFYFLCKKLDFTV